MIFLNCYFFLGESSQSLRLKNPDKNWVHKFESVVEYNPLSYSLITHRAKAKNTLFLWDKENLHIVRVENLQ